MKTSLTILGLLIAVLTASAQAPETAPADLGVNYELTLQIKEGRDTMELRVVTTAGKFKMQTLTGHKPGNDKPERPSTLSFDGSLDVVHSDKCRLTYYLGRTFPYMSGQQTVNGKDTPIYSQIQVGVNSTVTLVPGKSMLLQSDDNQKVTVTLKRLDV